MTGVKYISFHEKSGYGIAARRYIAAIKKAGIPVTWTPMVSGTHWGLGYEPFTGSAVGDRMLDPVCNRRIAYDTVIVHMVPEYYPLWKRLESDKQVFGYTVWETDRIPRHWRPLLNSLDGLFVPCAWNKKVFRQCGVTVPIYVIPHIISEETLPIARNSLDIPEEDYVFYTINTWTERKAIWNTITCFLDTFERDDPVTLVVKTSAKDFTRVRFRKFCSSTRWAVKRLNRGRKKPAKIHLIAEDLTDEDILHLHARGDCYVSLCHSEGWGMGAFDAAGFGKPIIMTGFGGQLDYLPPDLSFLVDYRMIPVQDEAGKGSYSPDQNWAEPDIAQASRFMKLAFQDPKTAQHKGTQLGNKIRCRFGGTTVAEAMIGCITNHAGVT